MNQEPRSVLSSPAESFPTTYLSEDETRRYLRLPDTLSKRAFRERMRRAGIPPPTTEQEIRRAIQRIGELLDQFGVSGSSYLTI